MSFQIDDHGDLALRCDDKRVWTSYSSYSGYKAKFEDGVLKLYSKYHSSGYNRYYDDPIWRSGSHINPQNFVGEQIMHVSNEGFVGIYDSNLTKPLWKSESQCPGILTYPINLHVGAYAFTG